MTEPAAIYSVSTAPPAFYAYLRVSTDQQDVASQKHGILEYANGHGMAGLVFIEEVASG